MEANGALVQAGSGRRIALAAFSVSCFTLLTAVSALVRFPIPGSSVPFTMQVYMVLVAGLAGGMSVGAASQMLYVGLGALGLPVFAVGAGLIGPTGGYIVSFIPAAAVAGAIAGRSRGGVLRLAAGALAGLAFIYAGGFLHLALVWRYGFKAAFMAGVLPFLPFDLAKTALAALTAGSIRRWMPPGR